MVTPIAHSTDELLAKLDKHGDIYQTTSGPQLVHDGLAQKAAARIRSLLEAQTSLEAEITRLRETNRKLHRRVQEVEAPPMSVKAYRKMLDTVYQDLKCYPEKVDATIEAYTAAGGNSIGHFKSVAEWQIKLREWAERDLDKATAESGQLKSALTTIKETIPNPSLPITHAIRDIVEAALGQKEQAE